MELYRADEHRTEKTMTVGEIIEVLHSLPRELPVVAEWEGTVNSFLPESFRVVTEPAREGYRKSVLEICVDGAVTGDGVCS